VPLPVDNTPQLQEERMAPSLPPNPAAGGPKPGAGPTAPPAPSRPPRILIADDNPQTLELFQAYLEGIGFEVEVETAADGEETLRQVKQFQPDLILLDIMMPRISGFEVCKRLRADATTRDIGVLMLTALDEASDVERAVEAGTDDFLTKPINKVELLLRVRSILKSLSYKRELDRVLTYFMAVDHDKP
jgi:DNA-binding response OmpR family regulator